MNENMSSIQFESSRAKKKDREVLKKARQEYIDKVREQYEANERKKEQRKLRGEDTWMLPSVSDRVDQEAKELERIKHKKVKKEKKHKKEKKKKHKKQKAESSDGSESSEEEAMWVEKREEVHSTKEIPVVKGPSMPPTAQRDSWMEAPLDIIPTLTRDDIRHKKKREVEDEKERMGENLLDKPGQHSKELNPYWKDGGKGLPEEQLAAKKAMAPVNALGDGGVQWLKKAYDRCVEQSKEEGRSLEEVAAERWGSIEELEMKICDAERAQQEKLNKQDDRSRRSRCSRSRDRQRRRSRSRSQSPYRNDRSPNRHKSPQRSRRRSRSRDRSSRKYEQSPKRSRHRSKSRDRSPYRSTDRKTDTEKDSKLKSIRSRFMKPGEAPKDSNPRQSEDVPRWKRTRERSPERPSWKKKGFLKPGEMDHSKEERSEDRDNERSRKDKDIDKYEERSRGKDKQAKDERLNKGGSWKRDNRNDDKIIDKEYSSSSSSGADSDSATGSESEDEAKLSAPPIVQKKVLTETEMNQLGAKILRAEIMGNQSLADSLKQELEEARKVKSEHPVSSASVGASNSKKNAEQEEVVLTRTDRSGMVRPLQGQQHPIEARGGRRKKQKVATHDTKGKRERYFADDDKHSLHSMFEAEKLGTAEDSNAMFARLAGKSVEKTDDEYQIDDVFVNRANKKISDSKTEERERSMAIKEHRDTAKALDNCTRCLDHTHKHLIICIGSKVYLSVPQNRSMTEGHCLIVPLQHVTCATALDEEVWEEIQVFRKALTKMFETEDRDCVFMETAMKFRQQRHMVIECIPMEREVGDMAPIYFKKALMECESEWAQNKKVVDLKNRDVRRAIPKGFPYFSVDFGLQSGFAHVIEDEQTFPHYFGREIIGGMIDCDVRLWKKPPRESFEDQRQKVLKFAKTWKIFDITNKSDD
ncbi:unnamed protein product [Owenia fusiformis]|uniref:Uncharacterized protein n=1 Tax=Owenia fusiformis TaxID=6347 RepID=A0A8J1TG88_OWEFU|nr:unnamed protein product [Owenia fusiformis]